MNLTKRQKEILDFIRSYRSERGISPTQREIRENFGLSSFGTIQKHLVSGVAVIKQHATRAFNAHQELFDNTVRVAASGLPFADIKNNEISLWQER